MIYGFVTYLIMIMHLLEFHYFLLKILGLFSFLLENYKILLFSASRKKSQQKSNELFENVVIVSHLIVPRLGGLVVSVLDSWHGGWVRSPVEATFLSGVFSPLTSSEACEKSSWWLWKEKLC